MFPIRISEGKELYQALIIINSEYKGNETGNSNFELNFGFKDFSQIGVFRISYPTRTEMNELRNPIPKSIKFSAFTILTVN